MSTLANFNIAIKAPAGVLPEVPDFTHQPQEALAKLARYFDALAGGMEPGATGENTLTYQKGSTAAGPVAATGTITMATSSGVVGATIAGTLVTVTWATTDAHSSALLANAINANATVNKLVKATAVGAVTTLTALQPGVLGNFLSLVASGTNVTVDAALLSGGVGANQEPSANASATLTIAATEGDVGAIFDGTLLVVTWGTSDTATALALAKLINAHAVIGAKFSAQSAAGVITLRARTPGKAGNDLTLVASATLTAVVTASSAKLSGGTGISTSITFSR